MFNFLYDISDNNLFQTVCFLVTSFITCSNKIHPFHSVKHQPFTFSVNKSSTID